MMLTSRPIHNLLRSLITCIVLMALPLGAVAQDSAEEAAEWRFVLGFYGWLAGIDGVVAVGSRNEFPVDVAFDDLFANLDFALSMHFEGKHRSGWSFLTDVFFVNLGTSGTVPPDGATLTLDQKQVVLEGGFAYEFARDWEVLAVGRYNNLSVSVVGDSLSTQSHGASFVDVFGGIRYSPRVSDRWALSFRTDVGTGGSDLAWFLNASTFYRMSDMVVLAIGYRGLSVDYETGEGRDRVKWDMFTHGLSLGIALTP